MTPPKNLNYLIKTTNTPLQKNNRLYSNCEDNLKQEFEWASKKQQHYKQELQNYSKIQLIIADPI